MLISPPSARAALLSLCACLTGCAGAYKPSPQPSTDAVVRVEITHGREEIGELQWRSVVTLDDAGRLQARGVHVGRTLPIAPGRHRLRVNTALTGFYAAPDTSTDQAGDRQPRLVRYVRSADVSTSRCSRELTFVARPGARVHVRMSFDHGVCVTECSVDGGTRDCSVQRTASAEGRQDATRF